MTDVEALNLVKRILIPDGISHVQEIVFKYSWEGRLYPQIAKDAGYHPEYIRDVGAQLWRALSTALDQKVTKKNVRYILTHLDPDPLPNRDIPPLSSPSTAQSSPPQSDMVTIAFPSVAVPLQSPFYIPPDAAETQAQAEIVRPSGLLRLRAAGNRGKTSLVLRLLDYARQTRMKTVLINFQEAEASILGGQPQLLGDV